MTPHEAELGREIAAIELQCDQKIAAAIREKNALLAALERAEGKREDANR